MLNYVMYKVIDTMGQRDPDPQAILSKEVIVSVI